MNQELSGSVAIITGGNPEVLLGALPLGRFGTPEAVAAGVIFLASPEAS